MITDFYADETARALTEEIFPALERAARAEFWTILGETDVDESDCAEIRTQGDLLLKHISAYLAGLVEMYSTYGLRAFGSQEA